MARSFQQSLLAAAVAVVVGGSALAQDTALREAVNKLRTGKPEELSADPQVRKIYLGEDFRL